MTLYSHFGISRRTSRGHPTHLLRYPLNTTTRVYCPGDELQLATFWQHCYASYGGFVARTVEHWRWAVLARPGVEHEDILLVESGGKLQAYGALGPKGSILELAVEPNLPARKRRRALQQLVAGLEQRARERQFDVLTCSAPMNDQLIANFMLSAGYQVDEGVFVSLGIVNPMEAIRLTLTHRLPQLQGWEQTFLLELTPGYYRNLSQTLLLIRIAGTVSVEDYSGVPDASAGCRIATDLTTLTDVMFGGLSAQSCFTANTVITEPREAAPAALRLLEALSIRTPWQVPTSDVF